MNPTASHAGEFRRGWSILAIALIGIVTSAGVIPLYSFGALVNDLSETLGRTPGELQRAITFFFIGLAIGSQLGGWLIARFGVRRATLSSLVALALTFAVTAIMPLNLWTLYLMYFLFPVVGCGTLQVSWTQVTCQWFERRRGLALAIILSGTGFSSMLLPLALTQSMKLGHWQLGYLILGLFPLLTWALAYVWLREPKVPATTPADGAMAVPLSQGLSFREAMGKRNFWIITVALVLVVYGVLAMVTNLVPLARARGLSAGDAALVYSAFGVFNVIGRLSVGVLLDHLPVTRIAFVSLLIPGIGCLILLSAPPELALLMLGAALIGIGAGAEYDIAAYIVTRYFGLREYSKIFGTMMGAMTLVLCLAPLFYGYMIDTHGGYDRLLMWCIGFFVAGSSLFLTLGRPTLPAARAA